MKTTKAQRNRDLALAAQAGDRKAMSDIVVENKGLILRVMEKHYPSIHPAETGDMLQEGAIGLMKAVETYDPSKGAFSTHATWQVRHILSQRVGRFGSGPALPTHEVKRRIREGTLNEGLSTSISSAEDPEELFGSLTTETFEDLSDERLDSRAALEGIFAGLDHRAVEALKAGWLTGISSEKRDEIAERFGTTRTYITKLIREGLKEVRAKGREHV